VSIQASARRALGNEIARGPAQTIRISNKGATAQYLSAVTNPVTKPVSGQLPQIISASAPSGIQVYIVRQSPTTDDFAGHNQPNQRPARLVHQRVFPNRRKVRCSHGANYDQRPEPQGDSPSLGVLDKLISHARLIRESLYGEFGLMTSGGDSPWSFDTVTVMV
jgi:hypothetical protein